MGSSTAASTSSPGTRTGQQILFQSLNIFHSVSSTNAAHRLFLYSSHQRAGPRDLSSGRRTGADRVGVRPVAGGMLSPLLPRRPADGVDCQQILFQSLNIFHSVSSTNAAVCFPLDQPGLMLPLFLILALAALWMSAFAVKVDDQSFAEVVNMLFPERGRAQHIFLIVVQEHQAHPLIAGGGVLLYPPSAHPAGHGAAGGEHRLHRPGNGPVPAAVSG